MVSARPSLLQRASSAEIEFCTGSDYATGACPYAQPSSGAGTCGYVTVESGICCMTSLSDDVLVLTHVPSDTFSDFPDVPEEILNNVNYVNIPNGTILTAGCNLYK